MDVKPCAAGANLRSTPKNELSETTTKSMYLLLLLSMY
jgi:hypothetical protein